MARPKSIDDSALLAMVREVLLREGPSVSVKVMARAVGLSEAALFKRFGTKPALVEAALGAEAPAPFAVRLEAIDGVPDVPEHLRAVAREALAFFRSYLPLSMARWVDRPPDQARPGGASDAATSGMRSVVSLLERAMRRGLLRPCNPEAVARVFIGSVVNFVTMEILQPSPRLRMDDEAFVNDLVDVVWNGIAPRSRGPRRPSGRT